MEQWRYVVWRSLSHPSFFQLLFNSNICKFFVLSTMHSTHVNVLLCSCFAAFKAQKNPRALSFHTLYSLILLFLGVAQWRCKLCVAHLSDSACTKIFFLVVNNINIHSKYVTQSIIAHTKNQNSLGSLPDPNAA